MDLRERVSELERELKALRGARRLPAAKVLLVAAAVAAGTATGFWLAGGRAYAEAGKGAGAVQGSSLTLVDEGGAKKAELGMAKGGAYLMFYDEKGKVRAAFGARGDGEPGMFLMDGEEKTMVELFASRGKNRLIVHDAEGKARFQVTVREHEVGLTLSDAKTSAEASLFVEKGDPSARLTNKEGKTAWSAP